MSAYTFPTNLATRFKFGQWDIGLWMSDDMGIGSVFALGYNDTSGWTVVKVIEGPYDQATWESIRAAAGGMGAYIVSKFPIINAALEKYFDPTPALPAETNATPFTIYDFNVVLKKYVGMTQSPTNDCPVLKLL